MNRKLIIGIIIGLIILTSLIIFIIIHKPDHNTSENNDIKYSASEENIETKNDNIINNNIAIEDTNTNIVRNDVLSKDISNTKNEQTIETKKENIDMIKIKVNNNVLNVKLEDNEATKKLVDRLKNGDISISASEYGGFEKVGNLGFNLPRSDKSMTTSAGDIVLYQGNQISLFYNSNSWSYTKLGKVQNISSNELKNILGTGDITLVLSLN